MTLDHYLMIMPAGVAVIGLFGMAGIGTGSLFLPWMGLCAVVYGLAVVFKS